MKLYTTPEQTAKLIELGFEKPKMAAPALKWVDGEPTFEPQYTIGELIKIFDGKVTLEIDNIGGIWMVAMPICDFTGAELIDCLFDACVKLKEEGVI